MDPALLTHMAVEAEPFKNHYVTLHHGHQRSWEISDSDAIPSFFLEQRPFHPTPHLDEKDVRLLRTQIPEAAEIQFFGSYRFIHLSQYLLDSEEEVNISFYLSEFYVVIPYQYFHHHIPYDSWFEKKKNCCLIENFSCLKDHSWMPNRTLFRLLAIVKQWDNRKVKIP